MKYRLAVMSAAILYSVSMTCAAASNSMMSESTMMNDNAKSAQRQGMSNMGEAQSQTNSMHNQMKMTQAQRQDYQQKLKSCQRDGRSAKECEAKLHKQMQNSKEMKKSDKSKMYNE